MITAYMVCGPSGCGKSTFVEKYITDHPNVYKISTDEIREKLWGDPADQRCGDVVFDLAYTKISELLGAGHDIIFDATNLSVRARKRFLRVCKKAGADRFVCFALNNDVNLCLARQLQRSRQVPKHIVKAQCQKYKMPTEAEGWSAIYETL